MFRDPKVPRYTPASGTIRALRGSSLETKEYGIMDQEPTKAPVHETANEARQGPLGRPVLNVLILSLLLALIAWGAAELYGGLTDDTAQSPTGQTSAPPAPPTNQPTTGTDVERNTTPQTGTGGDTQTNKP